MDIARCTANGVVYTAFEFSRLHPTDLSHMRRLLRCPECNGQAFFRRSSRNRGAPCFGARPHADDCRLATQDYVRPDDEVGESQVGIPYPPARIVVDFSYGAPTQWEPVGAVEGGTVRSHLGTIGTGAGQSAGVVQRRIGSLLRMLIKNPDLASSNQILEIFGKQIAAKNMLVPLLDVSERHEGCHLLFYGMLSDARYDSSYSGRQLWLNGGGGNNASFCIQADHVDHFLCRYRAAGLEDFAGAYALIFGRLRFSQSGKPYCIVDDPDYVALRLT